MLDRFLELTAPEVRLQIDIGWAGLMTDEVEAVKKYADRIQSIHCKDFYPKAKEGYNHTNMPEECFAPIGEGVIKTREIMGMLDELPLFDGSVVIDMDFLNHGAQEDYTTSYNNLVEYLGKEDVLEKYKGIVLPGDMKLPEIRKAVGPQMKIFVDCSIQSGMDAYKALALGADGVCVGRHLKKYLDQGGSEAVTGEIITMTKALCYAMEMTGVRTLEEMDPTVIHQSKAEW